jgi:formate dehydrogenase major subunit
MNQEDIERFHLRKGQKVRISYRRGSIVMPVSSETAILEGTAFASFHDPEYLVNILTGGPRDKYTDTYSYKYTAVKVEPFI